MWSRLSATRNCWKAFVVAGALCLGACSALKLHIYPSLCLNPAQGRCQGPADSQELPLRVIQVKEAVDVKSMPISWIDMKSDTQQPFASQQPLVPQQLLGYLADPQKPEYPVVMDLAVKGPVTQSVLHKEFRRHKDASWLLFVTLGVKSRKYWANLSERFYFWNRNIDVCVDHYDVFPNCKRFSIEVSGGQCPNVGDSCASPLSLYVYQLASRPAPQDYLNWREPMYDLAEDGWLKESSWLYRYTTNPSDPGAFVELPIKPRQHQDVRMRIVIDKEASRRASLLLLSVCGSHPVPNCARIVPRRDLKICIDRNAVYTDDDVGYQSCVESSGGN